MSNSPKIQLQSYRILELAAVNKESRIQVSCLELCSCIASLLRAREWKLGATKNPTVFEVCWTLGEGTRILLPALSSDLGKATNSSGLHLHLEMKGLDDVRDLSFLLPPLFLINRH